jgi:ubiquinol-cytochrome c reductase iron-sulfur subunit
MTVDDQPGVDPRPDLDPTHFGLGVEDEWPDDVPLEQDDRWWRYEGDPRGARRAELRIAFFWTLTMLSGIGLAIVYVVGGQPQAEGSLLFVGFTGLGVGMVLWARDLLPGHDVTASRGHHAQSPEHYRGSIINSLERGTEPIARRPFLGKMLGLVGGVFGLALLFPIASLGPRPGRSLYETGWGRGTRVVTVDGTPVRPTDVAPNGILTVFPEGGKENAQSSVVLINISGLPYEVQKGRESWVVNGLVAYSKICTHAGCPVGLYNTKSHQLICPCHQSTFDVLRDCKPVFGPASRPLQQLPLAVNQDGFLISQSNFPEPVGPGFWNR